jgi:hypothetical protein
LIQLKKDSEKIRKKIVYLSELKTKHIEMLDN